MKLDEMVSRMTNVHLEVQCVTEFCTIHNPSDHHMKDWDVGLRSSGLIERYCSHGIGHPDPDSWPAVDRLARLRWGPDAGGYDVHGCDGCCFGPEAYDKVQNGWKEFDAVPEVTQLMRIE